MTEDIAMLGLGVDSGPVRNATGDLKAFDVQARMAEASARAFKVGMGILIAGAAAFGVGITGAIMRMEEMDRLLKQVDRGLANSGNTARTSALEISRWADMLEARTGRAAEEVMRVSTNLASFGFGRAEFFRALELADDMASAWGGDLKQNLEGLSRALDAPLEGMAMLSKRGIKLTEEQKDMAAAFLDAGNKIAAQGVVFDALEAQVKGVAEAGFGGLSAAIAKGRKAWDDAFEDMVRGTGQTGDLRDSLIRLVETISSPEFISAATSFGQVMVNMLTAIANAAVAAGNALRGIGDFLASGDAQVSTQGLEDELAGLDKLYANAHATAFTLSGSQQDEVADQMDNWLGRMEVIQTELTRRTQEGNTGTKPGSMEGFGDVDPYKGMTFQTDAAEKQAKAYDKLIASSEARVASLQAEAEGLGLTNAEAVSLANTQDLLNSAIKSGIDLSAVDAETGETRLQQLTDWSDKLTDAQLKLEGLHITLANRTPWEEMGDAIDELSERLQRGDITQRDYQMGVGEVAEDMAGKYASSASNVIDNIEKITDVMGLEGKKAFDIQKGISLARAVVAGGEAVVHAYNAGMVFGLPGAISFAAVAAAVVEAQVKEMAEQQFDDKAPDTKFRPVPPRLDLVVPKGAFVIVNPAAGVQK